VGYAKIIANCPVVGIVTWILSRDQILGDQVVVAALFGPEDRIEDAAAPERISGPEPTGALASTQADVSDLRW
jgi:hypothetical protein